MSDIVTVVGLTCATVTLAWAILSSVGRRRYDALDVWLAWTMVPLDDAELDGSAWDLEERLAECERRMLEYNERSASVWRTLRNPKGLWPEQLKRERAGAAKWTPETAREEPTRRV